MSSARSPPRASTSTCTAAGLGPAARGAQPGGDELGPLPLPGDRGAGDARRRRAPSPARRGRPCRRCRRRAARRRRGPSSGSAASSSATATTSSEYDPAAASSPSRTTSRAPAEQRRGDGRADVADGVALRAELVALDVGLLLAHPGEQAAHGDVGEGLLGADEQHDRRGLHLERARAGGRRRATSAAASFGHGVMLARTADTAGPVAAATRRLVLTATAAARPADRPRGGRRAPGRRRRVRPPPGRGRSAPRGGRRRRPPPSTGRAVPAASTTSRARGRWGARRSCRARRWPRRRGPRPPRRRRAAGRRSRGGRRSSRRRPAPSGPSVDEQPPLHVGADVAHGQQHERAGVDAQHQAGVVDVLGVPLRRRRGSRWPGRRRGRRPSPRSSRPPGSSTDGPRAARPTPRARPPSAAGMPPGAVHTRSTGGGRATPASPPTWSACRWVSTSSGTDVTPARRRQAADRRRLGPGVDDDGAGRSGPHEDALALPDVADDDRPPRPRLAPAGPGPGPAQHDGDEQHHDRRERPGVRGHARASAGRGTRAGQPAATAPTPAPSCAPVGQRRAATSTADAPAPPRRRRRRRAARRGRPRARGRTPPAGRPWSARRRATQAAHHRAGAATTAASPPWTRDSSAASRPEHASRAPRPGPPARWPAARRG